MPNDVKTKRKKNQKQMILMGNEATARGIIDGGCTVVTSYPGTPASEVLSSAARFAEQAPFDVHVEWSVNEKAAFEVALSNSYAGCRSAVAMKQVGLNVASDPLMSAAYSGVVGGFLVVSADDPGPHSSQSEQDSRLMAMLAKVPVLDPSSPDEAYQMAGLGLELSEKFSLPVILRPTTRVCHARQNVLLGETLSLKRNARFEKNPKRWAATPKFRYHLHKELNQKLDGISREASCAPRLHPESKGDAKACIVSSGVAYSYVLDILNDLKVLNRVSLYQTPMPFPLSAEFLNALPQRHDKIMVVEETYPVIELQIPDRRNVYGKLSGDIPREGEITPDVIAPLLHRFLDIPFEAPEAPAAGGQRPSLCPGCSHRASYFAIRKALPDGIYPGDFGCYTLGVNMGGVDTCLCMGASINQAAGFYHSFRVNGGQIPSIVATIGDSTFVHSGLAALANSVYNQARFVLVILDNSTTAMTGNQPTPLTGILADGSTGTALNLEKMIASCGIDFLKVVDPYDVEKHMAVLKEADEFSRADEGGIAVIIARRPCIMIAKREKRFAVTISDECNNCHFCLEEFGCPALVAGREQVAINKQLCYGCGVCVHACPSEAIQIES